MPPVKNEVETDDEDEKPISQVRDKTKKKPSSSTPISKQVKKEEPQESAKKPSKPTPRQAKPKKEEEPKDDKKNVKRKREEVKNGNADVKKKERKVYSLPGQKRDPPEERDPLRIFYETLHEQTPTSEMAAVWMMESGLLTMEEAKQVYEKKMSSKNRKLASPTKPIKTVKETKSVTVKKKVEPSTPKTSNNQKTTTMKTTTVSKQTKKRKAEDSSSDEDSGEEFVVSTKRVVRKVKAN